MPGAPSQNFVPIKQIRDGVVLLKDGGYRGVLAVSAINLGLKSAEEQEATIYQFQNFVNILDFSVQIVVQSRRMDIRPYLQSLEDRLEVQKEELLRIQTQMYINYVRALSEQIDLMKKFFYVVVPYVPSLASVNDAKGPINDLFKAVGLAGKSDKKSKDASPEDAFDEARIQLEQRMALVQQGLMSMGLQVEALDTEETIEVFYNLYNPGDSQDTILKEVRA